MSNPRPAVSSGCGHNLLIFYAMLLVNILKLYTFVDAWKKRGRRIGRDDVGPVIEDAAVAIRDGRIAWVGADRKSVV